MTVGNNSGPIPNEKLVAKGSLAAAFGFLFPNDKDTLNAEKPVRGFLQIPNIGKLQVIGTTSNVAALRIYFPSNGESQCEADWQQLKSQNSPPVIPGVPGNSGVQGVQPATPVKPIGTPITIEAGQGLPMEAFGISDQLKKTKPAIANQAAPPAANTEQHIPSPMPMPMAIPGAPVVIQQVAAQPTEDEPQMYFEAARPGEHTFSSGRNPIDRLLHKMVEMRASDMHLTGGEPVVFRVDGDITRIEDEQHLSPTRMRELLMPIIPERNQKEFVKINDTDFAYEVENLGRFRVNVFRDKNGVGAVLRHIPSKILTAEQLKLSPAIMNLCKLNKGLVVVTGPTGSGKSTTLAGMLDWINKNRHEHLLTVEDPIEFVHPQMNCLVNQREVHRHTTSFARALKAALREDPDIILIGEMRDLETIAIAIETAETGHLVFGTLHTTTAISTVDRIMDQFPADRQEQIRTMLSSSLRGVVAQTLVKKKGGGRVAAQEILIVNDAVSALIREGKTHMLANHMQTQKAEGNQLLNEALMKYVTEGLIDPADAYMKAVDKNSLLEIMKRKGVNTAPFEVKKSA